MKRRRYLVPALAATLAVPSFVLSANLAEAARCKAPTGLLQTSPKSSYNLPGGASVRIWDTGNKSNNLKEVRIVAVRIPQGSLIPRATTASTLSKAATPLSQNKRKKSAVVVINGGVFDPTGPSIPVRSQVIKGKTRKGNSGTDQGLALYESSRSAEWTLHRTAGTVTSGAHGDRAFGAQNWQSLSGQGVSVYTRAWGSARHPAGNRTVVVKDGKVVRKLTGTKAGSRAPERGETHLTARSGSGHAAWIASLRIGESIAVRTAQDGVLPLREGRPTVGKPDSLIGVSALLVRDGSNRAGCGKRDETLRPRSGLLWTANGDLIVATVSGRPTAFAGGASAHQWGEYMKQLGAVNAVNLDGGTSVTLLVRKKVGGKLTRLDRSNSSFQRAVPDALTFVVP